MWPPTIYRCFPDDTCSFHHAQVSIYAPLRYLQIENIVFTIFTLFANNGISSDFQNYRGN